MDRLVYICLVLLLCTLAVQGKELKHRKNRHKARLHHEKVADSSRQSKSFLSDLACSLLGICSNEESSSEGDCGEIPDSWICDGWKDCDDGSDEAGCDDVDFFICDDGDAIPGNWKCDFMSDCRNSEDEETCANEFSCNDGYYVYTSWVCDGEEDCDTGRDEKNCGGSPGTSGGADTTGDCTRQVQSVNPSATGELPVVLECGVRGRSISKRSQKLQQLLKKVGVDVPERIIGGEPSTTGQWPWLVGIAGSDGQPFCGGTMIAPQWVVTAAHCITPRESVCDYKILLGEHNLVEYNEPDFQNVVAERVLFHSGYDDEQMADDIALIKLSRSFDLADSEYISAACLPERNYNMKGKTCYVAGWGVLEYGDTFLSTVVQHIETPVFNDTFCKSIFGRYISDGMFCAGSLKGDKDSCQGDSGGPLMCDDGSGRFTLGGVVSWGNGCAQKDFPGVYTRVSDYLGWIESTIAEYDD